MFDTSVFFASLISEITRQRPRRGSGRRRTKDLQGLRPRGSMLFTRTGANISENEGSSTLKVAFALQRTWVRGPEVPADLLGEDFLTPEDHRDITLDHIERTSDVISKVEIRLIAAA